MAVRLVIKVVNSLMRLILNIKQRLVPGYKQFLLISILMLLFVLGFSSIAFADEYAHGNYTANTNACALCHSTHTANAPDLLSWGSDETENATYRLCIFCHDGSGSKYDVLNGQISGSDTAGNSYMWASSAGGFVKMPTLQGDASYADTSSATVTVTSQHAVDAGSTTDTFNYTPMPGGNHNYNLDFKCTSCHDPHGTDNPFLLQTGIPIYDNNNTVTTFDTSGILVTYTSGDTITTNDSTGIANATGRETFKFNDKIDAFCSACHLDYDNESSADQKTGTYDTTYYRHQVGMAPGTGNQDYKPGLLVLPLSEADHVTCLTCHYSHGTTAMVSTSTYNPPAPTRPSTLLRLDERGVCENCHNKSPNITVKPAIINSYTALTSDQLHSVYVLTFSTYMNSAAAQTTGNYTNISSGLTLNSAALQPDGKSVVLTFNTTSNSISVNVNNLTDINGTTMDTVTVHN